MLVDMYKGGGVERERGGRQGDGIPYIIITILMGDVDVGGCVGVCVFIFIAFCHKYRRRQTSDSGCKPSVRKRLAINFDITIRAIT